MSFIKGGNILSVINECLEGDRIFNIIEWWSVKNNIDNQSNDNIIERKIEIGEELIFLDAYIDEKNKTKPYAWLVKFKCKDGYVDDAANYNFVTEEEWNALKGYFYKCFNEK